MTLDERIARVRRRISEAAERSGRDPSEVRLVAVSKSFPVGKCREAVDAGIEDLGENRAQELRHKAAQLDRRARWHFIGHLQTNKVRVVVGTATLIHSVDRMDVATAIAERARRTGTTQDVLIQVNVADDSSKYGVDPDMLDELAREVGALEGLNLRGLMTMPPYPNDPEDSRPSYKELARLGRDLVERFPSAEHLSMGMTRDLEVAVEEGATLVRVGEALFGSRPAPI